MNLGAAKQIDRLQTRLHEERKKVEDLEAAQLAAYGRAQKLRAELADRDALIRRLNGLVSCPDTGVSWARKCADQGYRIAELERSLEGKERPA